MPSVSVTRMRLRSFVYLPQFFFHAVQTRKQVERAPGFLRGAILPDRHLAYWTMSVWDSLESMRAYMLSGAHKRAMPLMITWCSEASVVHWEQDGDALPSWKQADRRMRESGRASKVTYPSCKHAELAFEEPEGEGGFAVVRR